MLLALILALVGGETLPPTVDIGLSIAAGVAGGIGITALYQGLAVGRMGVVAPVTGVLAAIIPVTVGIGIEGAPGPIVLGGIALAIIAVVLVSRVPGEGTGPSGIWLALGAGVAIGSFGVLVSQISDGHALGPLTIIRAAEAVLIGAIIVLTGSPWRPHRRLVPAIAAVGVLDMLGNGAFIVAVQTGALAIAAVLSSLYPVTTVILAAVILHERVTRSHAFGIVLAIAAIVCIALGSAG